MKAGVMFRLDYISCVLTVSAAILLGQKRWQGWLVAGINSILVCDIAVNTSQTGFIPANVFCVALYAYNILGWRKQIKAHRVLERVNSSVDAAATTREIEDQCDSVPQVSTKRPVLIQPDAAGLRAAMVCCGRSTPSFPEGDERFPGRHVDLRNLLSCSLEGRLSVN
jgi:hypothetical protein